jgi:hypothetical protein
MNPIFGNRYPNTITNISGCIVVRSRKKGSSRRATRISRRSNARKMDDERTSGRVAGDITAAVIRASSL